MSKRHSHFWGEKPQAPIRQFYSTAITASTWINNKIVEPILYLKAYNNLENLNKEEEEEEGGKKKKILACSSAYGLWDMQEVITTLKECSVFFPLRAIFNMRRVPALDNFKSSVCVCE